MKPCKKIVVPLIPAELLKRGTEQSKVRLNRLIALRIGRQHADAPRQTPLAAASGLAAASSGKQQGCEAKT